VWRVRPAAVERLARRNEAADDARI
jgi:hypothetical protein